MIVPARPPSRSRPFSRRSLLAFAGATLAATASDLHPIGLGQPQNGQPPNGQPPNGQPSNDDSASGEPPNESISDGPTSEDAPLDETLYVPDDTDRAVSDAVDYLVEIRRGDGSIHDRGHAVAMTSLSIMAMASVGVTPESSTPRGRALSEALDFVLDERNQDDQGYFGNRDGSRMYGHGITTLMLTELHGMGVSIEQNRRIHASLEKALRLILAAQAVSKRPEYVGGWRYTPTSKDSDLSVSIWQLMALRSARNDGLDVPGEAIDTALQYLRNSYTSPIDRDGNPRAKVAGFSYTPGTRSPSFTMTSAGLLAMQVCGEYDSPLVSGAVDWLIRNPPRSHERFFFYGVYYYAQGMHQVGGRRASTALRLVSALLLDEQRSDGSWIGRSSDEQRYGNVYATALAVLSLSVRYHYLPIYQR